MAKYSLEFKMDLINEYKKGKRKADKIINQDKKLKYAYKAKELYLHAFKQKNVDEFNSLIDVWRNYVIRYNLSEFNSLLVTLDSWSISIK